MSVAPKLVGVTGYAQHGKDSIGRILVEDFGMVRHAFADQLKAMALVLNPIIYASTDPLYAGVTERLSDWVEAAGWEEAKKNPEVRRFLQVLGTEGVRDMIGDSAWVDALDRVVFDKPKSEVDTEQVVITDVRFLNEAQWVKKNRGIIIKVKRPGHDSGVSRDHPSEMFIESIEGDYDIINSKGLAQLRQEVARVMWEETMRPKARWHREVDE